MKYRFTAMPLRFFLGRLFDLIKPVRPSTKSFFDFSEICHVGTPDVDE